ncbi:hypothetical protein ABZU25_16915 [Micromonospora sp. NPDC005215]|uniref:hypothetical protein n=1 Tax=Micromonospora sp. NPDC005215 TaxID=3157024 RepID=UPI0033BE0785
MAVLIGTAVAGRAIAPTTGKHLAPEVRVGGVDATVHHRNGHPTPGGKLVRLADAELVQVPLLGSLRRGHGRLGGGTHQEHSQ